MFQTLTNTLCKPLKHTNKKVYDEGANQQNDIITSEYLEEVHHLQYPSHAFTVLTARSEEWNKNKQRVGGVCCRHLPTPGGTPKAGTCSSERRAGIVFHW